MAKSAFVVVIGVVVTATVKAMTGYDGTAIAFAFGFYLGTREDWWGDKAAEAARAVAAKSSLR